MIWDWLSLVDVAFIGVTLLFAFAGMQKGFASQIAHILTFLILGVVLFYFYPAIFNYFGRVFRNVNETYLTWVILTVVVALVIGFFLLLSKLLSRLLKGQISDRSDRFYGFVLGSVRGALVALFGMIFLVILGPPHVHDVFTMKSRVGKLVCYEMVPRIQPHMTRAVLEEKSREIRNKLLDRKEGGKID